MVRRPPTSTLFPYTTLFRSARLTVASRRCNATGFSRKSSAPTLVASTAVSMVPCPDIMTTGMVSCPLAAHSFSNVMPSVSGIQISSSTRSGLWRSRNRRADSAFSASSTWWPSSDRISDSSSRMPTSSSTIMICDICAIRLKSSSCGFRLRQEHADRGALGRVVLDRDRAAVLVYDLLHDRETEAGSARLRRHVGLEDARHQLRRKTIAVVRHREPHLVRHKLGAYLDRGFAPRSARLRKRILRVLQQVVEDLADLGRVGPDRRQLGREPGADRHVGMLVEREHLADERI